MMGRCPPAWGQPATSTTQDVMGKVHMLEEVMTSHMELQRKQMEKLSQEDKSSQDKEKQTLPFMEEIKSGPKGRLQEPA